MLFNPETRFPVAVGSKKQREKAVSASLAVYCFLDSGIQFGDTLKEKAVHHKCKKKAAYAGLWRSIFRLSQIAEGRRKSG